MPTFTMAGTTEIKAAPAHVLAVAADCARYPEVFLECVSAVRLAPAFDQVNSSSFVPDIAPPGLVYRLVLRAIVNLVIDVRVAVDSAGGMTLTRVDGPLIPALNLRLRATGTESQTELAYTLELELLGQPPSQSLQIFETQTIPRWLQALNDRVLSLLSGGTAGT